MNVKSKNIQLTVAFTKRVSDIAVCISIPFSGIAQCCLKKLSCNCSEPSELMQGSEEAALAYALFETVRDKLTGSALEVFKTKVSNISCYAIGDIFSIQFNTQATGTNLRKTCGLALSCFSPQKLYSKYSENIRMLCGKPGKKTEFNYCVKKMIDGIKKSVDIVCVGKIKTDNSKLKDIVDVIQNKMPEMDAPSAKESEAPPKRQKHDEVYPVIKCSGIAAAGVADYLRSNFNGVSLEVSSHGVVVYNTTSKLDQLKDKHRIKDYFEKKYNRLDNEFANLFAYFSLTQKYVNSDTLSKIINGKLTPSKLTEFTAKALL